MPLTNRDIMTRLMQLPEIKLQAHEMRRHHAKMTEEQIKRTIENQHRYAVSTTLCNLQTEGSIEIDRTKNNPEYKITEKGLKQLASHV